MKFRELILIFGATVFCRFLPAARETLHPDVFIGEADSWDVTSTLIYGKSEAILVDCRFRISQAKKLAEQVVARGWRFKTIIVTCPDSTIGPGGRFT
jgi:hypothetical protein